MTNVMSQVHRSEVESGEVSLAVSTVSYTHLTLPTILRV